MDIVMKKIVIIGATGYVGSAILKEALGRGHQVKVIVRNPSKLILTHPNLIFCRVSWQSRMR